MNIKIYKDFIPPPFFTRFPHRPQRGLPPSPSMGDLRIIFPRTIHSKHICICNSTIFAYKFPMIPKTSLLIAI